MGGSILFTQSATFSPSVYGLTTGKFINYIIIGGGGAGGSTGTFSKYTYNGSAHSDGHTTFQLNSGGSNGGTSSIGSYISASGGKTPVNTGTSYTSFYPIGWDSSREDYAYGGVGAGGWIPGKIFNAYQEGGQPFFSSTSSNLPDYVDVYDHGGQKIALINTSKYAEGGWCAVTYPSENVLKSASGVGGSPNPYNLTQNAGTSNEGSDGIGYGAGGGGQGNIYDSRREYSCATQGGSSGQFKQGSFKLTSTADIAITVGAGGTPHTTMGSPFTALTAVSNTVKKGRIGTHGAVMLFWD